ncbi:unnamed protein product, partial [Mesorhabditis belari]|uniref:Uncharacterized protein n=1 Tax=Mesorhabditis belari TaxID=2138241 RepID=A0AAF3EJP2_9BILA
MNLSIPLFLFIFFFTKSANGFLNSISALNELAELGKKVYDFFDDNKAQTTVGVMLSKNVTAEKKIQIASQLAEPAIRTNPKLNRLNQDLREDLNATLTGLRNNWLMKRTLDSVLKQKLKSSIGSMLQNGTIEKLPVSFAKDANRKLAEALYQNGRLTIQLANNISGIEILGDGTSHDSLIIDLGRAITTKFESLSIEWSEKLSSVLNGVSANKMLIETFQGKVMAGLELLGNEMNFSKATTDDFRKNLYKTFDVCFDTTMQNIQAKYEKEPGVLQKLRTQFESQFDVAQSGSEFSLTNLWKETSTAENLELMTEMERLFEKKLTEHLATQYFNDNELGPYLGRSIHLLQKTMETNFKDINEQLSFQNSDLKNFIENQAHLEHERKFIEKVLVPVNLTMAQKLEYLKFNTNKIYWRRFQDLYDHHKIVSIPEEMRIYYERNLKELLQYEKRRDEKFDFQAYEHFRELYIHVYQMAWDLRHFRETQDQVDLDAEFLQREHEKKENATRDFRETDRKLRKDVATLEFNHFANGKMRDSVHDLSDELGESEFEMIFRTSTKFSMDISGKTPENHCKKQSFTLIHEGHHHGHIIRQNSTEGAQFFLFREHDEISKSFWQDLLTQIYDGFSNLDPFATSSSPLTKESYIESLRVASHKAVVKICTEKINNKHKCKFVLTSRAHCLFPRESKENFITFVGPHKSIKIVIGL